MQIIKTLSIPIYDVLLYNMTNNSFHNLSFCYLCGHFSYERITFNKTRNQNTQASSRVLHSLYTSSITASNRTITMISVYRKYRPYQLLQYHKQRKTDIWSIIIIVDGKKDEQKKTQTNTWYSTSLASLNSYTIENWLRSPSHPFLCLTPTVPFPLYTAFLLLPSCLLVPFMSCFFSAMFSSYWI